MSSLAPLGTVYQAGTLSGNPLATAAGVAVLNHVTIDELALLAGRVRTFATDMQTSIRDTGLFALTPNIGPLMGLYLSDDEVAAPSNFEEAKALNENGLFRRFFHAMLERGVALAPGSYEIVFTSMAHTVDDLERTVSIAGEAAKEVVK
jgi:glutamate-1-semialdehyde 2,1-aminomutase